MFNIHNKIKRFHIAIIQSPLLFYSLVILVNKTWKHFFSIEIVKISQFGSCISLVINLIFLILYIQKSSSVKKKYQLSKLKKILTFILVVFLLVMAIIFFRINSPKDGFIMLFGVVLGTVYLVKGKIPDWYINFTQKFNFYTAGILTQDNDSRNIPFAMYGPILLGIILIAISAFVIFL